MANLFDLSGKVALITGANSGIGFGYAEAIARAGGDVVVWGRRAERNREAVDCLAAYGTKVMAQQVDVADERAQVEAFAAAAEKMGRLDCVIANAGQVTLAPVVDMSLQEYEDLQRVAQSGAFLTLREGARQMVRQVEAGGAPGSLIATGSLTNFTAIWGLAHYAAAKSAVAAVIRTLAIELGEHGIRANMVCAGLIETEMVPFDNDHQMGRDAAAKIPIGRMGKPQDLAGIVVYLMSDASRYHSGDVITVDGGRSINGM